MGDLGFGYCSITPLQISPSQFKTPTVARAYGSFSAMLVGAKDLHKYLVKKDFSVTNAMVKEGAKTQKMSGHMDYIHNFEFALEILGDKEYNSMALTYERGSIFSKSRAHVYLNKESKINRQSMPSNIVISEKQIDGWK